MTTDKKQDFVKAVQNILRTIPAGKVISYGKLAVLAGQPSQARLVGQILKNTSRQLPCHRVVNSSGRLVPGWTEQKLLLEAEGVSFNSSDKVDMRIYSY